MRHLFLNYSKLAERDNVDRVLGPPKLHPENPLTLNGEVVWKRNNLHFTWYRDEASGDFLGWHTVHHSSADRPDARWQPHVRRCRSRDGLAWEDFGEPGIAETVILDPSEPDPRRRYKCVYQGVAVLNEDGTVQVPMDRYEDLLDAARSGKDVNIGIFSACSADGVRWRDHRPVAIDAYRLWEPAIALGHNPDRDGKRRKHKWWKPGMPGWAGGDSFPCLMYRPEQREYVAYYRTNIDRRTSLFPEARRRERGVGRSECTLFGEWSEHELAMRSNVDWQDVLGYGKQDFYQLQVWRCADVYLGIVSVFYWEEDRNHLELAWSPDTIHWERVCPYHDLVPHGELGEFGGGNCYASMRPQEIDGEVRVYFGADNGRHNADGGRRESTLMLALFGRDRLAGISPKRGRKGRVATAPFDLDEGTLTLNADATAGEVRTELQDEEGQPIPGFTLEECEPLREDATEAEVRWKGGNLAEIKGCPVRLLFEFEGAVLYAYELT